MADVRTYNVVILGVGFMLIFTAFTTCGNIEQTVIKSLHNTTFRGSGYHSLGIIYGVFSFSNLFAPVIVTILGPRVTMFLSGLLYSCYSALFILPETWSFYLVSILIGLGASMLWTAQGTFLVQNSDVATINKHTGVFWGLLQCSMLFGNMYIYFDWRGKTEITDSNRKTMFVVLLGISVLGTLTFIVLRKTGLQEEVLSEEEGESLLSARIIYKQKTTIAVRETKSELSSVLQLFRSKAILLLSCSMAYSGLELSFYSGVYGTCIGATGHFGNDAKSLIGLSGIVVGLGEIIGGGLFGLLCKNNRFRRTSVVFLGMVVHFVAFYLIFLNIPNDAPVVFETSTQLEPYLSPSVSIALLCSFLLGLGDSCFNTQLYSILGCVFAEQSAPAFTIFKFIQSVSAALAFFCSGYLLLSWQLLIMGLFGFIGTLCFFVAEKTQVAPTDPTQY
ncbi:UNC93-like protein MFSD11 isoform X1 [Paramormyrops kingsleyae]|uniref:UNC93-like protein MFSD11 n=1 Tax=Paramormyrops kingsleyae TaxID=1676925 RepID=A0A3B3R7W2_9TELE|nr:UNC93-like protein MFSD11 isoform X1 [Paramormyrops kingsleyae]